MHFSFSRTKHDRRQRDLPYLSKDHSSLNQYKSQLISECVKTNLYRSKTQTARTVLQTRYVNPGIGKFRSVGTSKKYRRTLYSGIALDGKIIKIRVYTYRVLDPGFTMHA